MQVSTSCACEDAQLVETELLDYTTNPEIQAWQKSRLQAISALQSGDIADAVLYAVTQKPHVNINEILIRSIDQ
jgi:NADP-dependent 3-hydroxy acid dehydrogenase YdfG